MKNFFNKKSSGGNWKHPSDRNSQKPMHRATCAECSTECQVPFRPNGRKPVLCSDCFRKENGGGKPSFHEKRSSRPADSFEKPVYRSTPRDGGDETVKQLKQINAKMDQLLEKLTAVLDQVVEYEEEDDAEEMEF